MRGDQINDAHHGVRHCSSGQIAENGEVMDIAFVPRSSDSYLSIFCEEMLGQTDRTQSVSELRRRLPLVGLTLRKTGKLAFFRVFRAKEAALGAGKAVRVLHEPEDEHGKIDDSHCGIHGYQSEDLAVAGALRSTVEVTFPAKD